MAAIIRFSLVLVASAIVAHACTYCQCTFSDDSHCCVYSDGYFGDLNCTAFCEVAHRADGTLSDNGVAGTACDSKGSYGCISPITALGRTPCYKQSEP